MIGPLKVEDPTRLGILGIDVDPVETMTFRESSVESSVEVVVYLIFHSPAIFSKLLTVALSTTRSLNDFPAYE